MANHTLTDEVAEVQGVRRDVAERVTEAFPTREAIAQATTDQLTAVKGVGEVTADRIARTFTTATTDASAPTTGQASTAGAAEPTPSTEVPASTPTPTATTRPTATREEPRRHADASPLDQGKAVVGAAVGAAQALIGETRRRLPQVATAVGRAAGSVVQLGTQVLRSVTATVRDRR